MNKCGSSDLQSFSDADFRRNFSDMFQLRINRLDDVNFNVFSFNPIFDNRASLMCDSIVSNYGGYPVLHINGREPMNCCYTFDYQFAIKIAILCLLGIILFSLIIYAIFRVCKLRTEKTVAEQRPRASSASEKKISPWSTDLTVEGNKKTLPPAYSTLYFDHPTDVPPEYSSVFAAKSEKMIPKNSF